MEQLAIKIRETREELGLSQSDLAKLAGTNQATVDRIERGATRYSKYLDGVLRALQIYDETIPIIGEVIEQGAIKVLMDATEASGGEDINAEMIPSPPGVANGAALRVVGASMWPRYNPGDIIVFEQTPQDPIGLLDKTCVIFASDGQVWLKTLEAGSKPGFFNLASHNAPTLRDVAVDRAHKVAWLKPAD